PFAGGAARADLRISGPQRRRQNDYDSHVARFAEARRRLDPRAGPRPGEARDRSPQAGRLPGRRPADVRLDEDRRNRAVHGALLSDLGPRTGESLRPAVRAAAAGEDQASFQGTSRAAWAAAGPGAPARAGDSRRSGPG